MNRYININIHFQLDDKKRIKYKLFKTKEYQERYKSTN